ncbi:hypothetical protein BB560_007161 [Smittium megazygosporum]|uniref:Uncharacterized protein n=1 Tax=Smittium megazygosporum TaxID=133381 RepID=A0A2T9XYD6_9FUNG|nr:hypothetical protein BB560_007161 [Smittium megazygosporum]
MLLKVGKVFKGLGGKMAQLRAKAIVSRAAGLVNGLDGSGRGLSSLSRNLVLKEYFGIGKSLEPEFIINYEKSMMARRGMASMPSSPSSPSGPEFEKGSNIEKIANLMRTNSVLRGLGVELAMALQKKNFVFKEGETPSVLQMIKLARDSEIMGIAARVGEELTRQGIKLDPKDFAHISSLLKGHS